MIFNSVRLQFRKFEQSDFEDYLLLNTDPEVMKFITGKAMTIQEAKIKFKSHRSLEPHNEPLGIFRVALIENDRFIGLAKIAVFKKNQLETGYALLPSHWRKGYASEILQWTIEHAKSQKGINSLIALVNPKHEGSKKVLAKANFEFERSEVHNSLPTDYYELTIR